MTYIHLFVSTLITTLAREKKLIDHRFAAPIFAILSLALLFFVIPMRPGFLKYFVFFLFLVAVGQSTIPLVGILEDKGLLRKTMAMVAGMFLAMTALAFYDSQHFLGFGPYLFVGLIGLILARIGLWIAGYAEVPLSDLKTWDQKLSYIGVALFTVYTAYDTQNLKELARTQRGEPDYVNSSLDLYFDILNLFSNLGDIFAD